MTSLLAGTMKTPIGELFAVTDRAERLKILVMNQPKQLSPLERLYMKRNLSWRKDAAAVREVKKQLDAYFAGELTQFRLELAPEGTPFQHSVWDQLVKIPHGEVLSYGALAKKIGNPKASRGVGSANGANPIFIVVPCHRVIGSDGRLTGFGPGVDVKADLLRLEGHRVSEHAMPRILDVAAGEQMVLF